MIFVMPDYKVENRDNIFRELSLLLLELKYLQNCKIYEIRQLFERPEYIIIYNLYNRMDTIIVVTQCKVIICDDSGDSGIT